MHPDGAGDESHFNPQDLYKYANPNMVEEEEEEEDSHSDNDDLSPFEKMALKMENVTEDGLIKKMVLQPGAGFTVKPESYVSSTCNFSPVTQPG